MPYRGEVALQDLLVEVQLGVQLPQVLVHRRHQHANNRLAVADLKPAVIRKHSHHQNWRRQRKRLK